MKRAIPIFLLAVVVFVGWLMVLLRDWTGLEIDNPRFEQAPPQIGDRLYPSVMRYLSRFEGFDDRPSFGLVLEVDDGVPTTVLNLSAVEPALGFRLQDFQSNGGFDIADRLFDAETRLQEGADKFVEPIDPESLTYSVLPPVDLTVEELARSERFVIGVGFNYRDHRQETDPDINKFLFAKHVAPTGAYAPMPLGEAQSPFEGAKMLVDYEVEIGFVLLKDIYLDELPANFEELRRHIAFFTANDISDRFPIILQGRDAFTQAQSSPGHLPIGPWLTHGRHLDLRSRSGGMETADMWLRVDEAEPFEAGQWRQHASSSQMIRGPVEILKMASEVWSESRGTNGSTQLPAIAREVDGRGMIPAGSLILTGTPGGTAIESPGGMDRMRLMALGNLSMRGAKLAFAKHCVRNRREMGFLSVGDRVETRVQHLGRQIWTVVP